MKKLLKTTISLIVLGSLTYFSFAEPKFDLNLDVITMTIPGEQLARSGYSKLDKWYLRDVPVMFLPVAAISVDVHKKISFPDKNEKPAHPALISTNYHWISSLNPTGISSGIQYSVSITPLLTLQAFAGTQTAWNYSSKVKNIGLYDYTKAEYKRKTSLSGIAYQYGGEATVTAPLPKGNLLQGKFSSTYVGFTGADDKEIWKCGSENNSVNGWKYKSSIMLAHMYNNPSHAMLGIIGSASGWYSEKYFDDVYKPYDPDFVTFSLSPMFQMHLKNRQNLMINAVISRDRKFKNDDYSNEEVLVQVREGTQWKLKTIMVMWHIPLK